MNDHRIGVFLCRCGTNISSTVRIPVIVEQVSRLDDVVVARECDFLCADTCLNRLRQDITELGLNRVVVGACSPLMHEQTFRETCKSVGLDPFYLQMANLREQLSWVTDDVQLATAKGTAMVTAAINRARRQEALAVKQLPVAQAVLVVGAGITGIEAALRLADADKKVFVVEREPSIGGHMALLARTFPTLDCSACILVPKMANIADKPNVELLTYSEIEQVDGVVGSYSVTVRSRPRYVDADLCNGCGLCVARCPLSDIPSEIDRGLGTRSAIYFPFPQAIPLLPLIDAANCAHFVSDSCGICEKVCPTGAIDFEQREQTRELEVGSVVLATGFQLFDPHRAIQYGYGRWDNIITSLQFERLCHPSGPTGGEIVLKDGRKPESIAILHCVGSRDHRFNPHCSRICCMTSLKYALMARRRTGARVFSFYIDMRAATKHGEEFYEQAQRAGVVFVQGKGTEVIYRGGTLLVKSSDTQLGQRVVVPVDMVVLVVAAEPQHDASAVAGVFGIGCTEQGFFMEKHLKLGPVETISEGIFVAGGCQGPKDIPDSVAQGGAAAAGALALLDRGTVETVPTVAVVDADLCSGCLLCLHDCPYQAIEQVASGTRTVAQVSGLLCKSCGSCASTCPSGAIRQLGFTSSQIDAEIEGLLA